MGVKWPIETPIQMRIEISAGWSPPPPETEKPRKNKQSLEINFNHLTTKKWVSDGLETFFDIRIVLM